MYDLIEYSNNYSNTSGSLLQYYRELSDQIVNSKSFISKVKITGKTPAAGNAKNLEIAVPLKYLCNFWRSLEVPLLNCEINLILTWSEDCFISSAAGNTKLAITDTKLYAPIVTLSIQDNSKLLQQSKSGFKRIINWSKYQSKVSIERQNQYLDFLIAPSFQRGNRLLVLLFENENGRKKHTGYYLPTVEIKDYNVMIDGKNVFDQPVTSDTRTYDNIIKIATSQGDDYTTGCLLDYPYFKEHYKLIAIDLSKQQALYADPKEIHQINFTGNLAQAEGATMFFIIEEAKKAVLDFSHGTVKVLLIYFTLT